MLATTADLVRDARERGVGVAAFNVITLEHAEAIAAGAQAADRPAILQISENAVRYHHGRLAPLAAACVAIARTCPATLALHLDHIQSSDLLYQTVDCGASSAMFDAAHLSYDDNVAATRAAARWAHEHGLWLEAELGEIGGKDGAHAPGVRTDPNDARAFVAATGVDALAVAVGSSHAMTTRSASLDHDLIARLRDAVPVPLVLHGSSGVPAEEIRRGTAAGLVKINIGTLLNISFTTSVRTILNGHADVVDPRKYLGPAREQLAAVVADSLRALVE